MDEGAATVAGDTSGSANNSYFVNQLIWKTGHGGGSQHSLSFDGNGYIEALNSASLNSITTKFTMTAWIKADQNSINNDTIVWKLGGFRVWKNNAALYITLTGANATNIAVIPNGISNGVWHHVAITYNGQWLKGYLDGVLKYSNRRNGSDTQIATSSYPLRVGWYNGGPPHYRGSLDNVRLYNTELSGTEIIVDMGKDTIPTQPLTIVQSALATTAIVIPTATVTQVETVAANELQYHIKQATDVTLGIYEESSKPTTFAGLIYIGACDATAAAGISGSYLDENSYVVRNVGNDLFLAGYDSTGDPLGMQYGDYTRVGTMLAVYRFLEQYMHVKWLWPGPTGEIIPTTANLTADGISIIGKPVLKHTRLNDYNTFNWGDPSEGGWASPETRQNYLNAQSLWMRRQGFCMSINLESSHAFGTWWDTYNLTHPEYFNLLPDGTRCPDPYFYNGRWGYLISMCLSEPNLHKQIVDNWVAAGASGYIWCAENDTPNKCTCPRCMAWDEPDPDLTIPWAERLTYAGNAFNAGDSNWYTYLGSMSTRFAKYLLAVQHEAESRGYTNAKVFGFAYENYVKAPIAVQLNERVTIGVVPPMLFPWTDEKQEYFRNLWSGWAKVADAQTFLRPNYFLEGHNLPINFAQRFGSDFLYALRRDMFATIFDSLTGQWSTQGPNLYMLARVQTHVSERWENWRADVNGDGKVDMSDLAVLSSWWLNNTSNCEPGNRCGDINNDGDVNFLDFAQLGIQWHHNNAEAKSILDEFYNSFGPAESAVRAYFDYWETISDAATTSPHWGYWFVGADEIFTPTVMATGRTLITNAQTAAEGAEVAERLVDFLEKGFTNAQKTLATQKAWENFQNYGASYLAAWEAAHTDLLNYRASVEADFICNMDWLHRGEAVIWQY